jgi:predicted dehydrogenase
MYSVGIVGAGRIFKKHYEALNKLSKYFKLIAVCDKKITHQIKSISKKKNIFFYDMTEMVKKCKPDIIVILTESGNHIKHYLQLEKLAKNFIIEKPLGLFSKDIKKIISSKKKFKNNIFVVKQNRFNPPVIKLKNSILKKQLGKVFMSTSRVRWKRDQNYYNLASWRGTRNLDGGVIGNQASHHLDALIWLNGKVQEVFAHGIKALAKIESEDTIIANLKFKNGSIGVLEATTATRPIDIEGSLSVLGSKGIVEISGFAMNKIKIWKTSKKIFRKFKENYEIKNVYGNGHLEFYKNVYYNLKGKDNDVIKFEDAVHVSKVIESINISIKKNKTIKVT